MVVLLCYLAKAEVASGSFPSPKNKEGNSEEEGKGKTEGQGKTKEKCDIGTFGSW